MNDELFQSQENLKYANIQLLKISLKKDNIVKKVKKFEKQYKKFCLGIGLEKEIKVIENGEFDKSENNPSKFAKEFEKQKKDTEKKWN